MQGYRKPMADVDRLKYRVTDGGCWEWSKYRNSLGYGLVGIGSRTDGTRRVIGAHRLSYQIHRGEIPDGLNVLHTCDNPPCINPAHLYLGTDADNNRDMRERGRAVILRGTEIGTSKLTEVQVWEIKQLLGKVSDCEIARRFDVSDTLIWNIRHGISWRHISVN